MRAKVVLVVLAVLMGLPGAVPAQAGQWGRHNGQITFGRFDPALGDFSMWAANPDGTGQRRLTSVPTLLSDWSPDGHRIAFNFIDGTGSHVATMAPDGQDVRQLTFGQLAEDPKWSPDGRWITFGSTVVFDPFSTQVWTMRADGSDARQVSRGGFDLEPVFSPDGRRIAFGRILGEVPEGQLEALFVMDADGTHVRQVLPALPGFEHADWSPDGRWITFNIGPENPQAPNSGSVMAVRPNGTGLRVLRAATDRLAFFQPVWSPNGRRLLVGCSDAQAGVDQLCVMNAHGRNLTVIIAGTREAPVNYPAWGSLQPTRP